MKNGMSFEESKAAVALEKLNAAAKEKYQPTDILNHTVKPKPTLRKGCVSVDFDGIIHSYESGWGDGTIYGHIVPQSLEGIMALLNQKYSVFIMTARSPSQIIDWFNYLNEQDNIFTPEHLKGMEVENMIPFKYQLIPEDMKFWYKKGVVGVTNRKLPADIYLDDRAVCFTGDWSKALEDIANFKTYIKGK